MFRHLEDTSTRKRISEEVLRGMLSILGGIIVIGLLVLVIGVSG